MRLMFITMARKQSYCKIDGEQFVDRELDAVKRATMIEDIASFLFYQPCSHRLQNRQIAENSSCIHAKFSCKLSCCQSLRVLRQHTLNLLNPLYTAIEPFHL